MTHLERAREILSRYQRVPKNNLEDLPYIQVDSWEYDGFVESIAAALKQEREQGMVEGLEEGAKVAGNYCSCRGSHNMRQTQCSAEIAKAIRLLKNPVSVAEGV